MLCAGPGRAGTQDYPLDVPPGCSSACRALRRGHFPVGAGESEELPCGGGRSVTTWRLDYVVSLGMLTGTETE